MKLVLNVMIGIRWLVSFVSGDVGVVIVISFVL